MLWECSSYSMRRDNFQEALKQLLGARYAEFERLSTVEKILCAHAVAKTGRTTSTFAAFSEGVHCSCMGSAKTTMMTHSSDTQVNFSASPRRRSGSRCWSWG